MQAEHRSRLFRSLASFPPPGWDGRHGVCLSRRSTWHARQRDGWHGVSFWGI